MIGLRVFGWGRERLPVGDAETFVFYAPPDFSVMESHPDRTEIKVACDKDGYIGVGEFVIYGDPCG